jgi:hypothetical protein
MKRKKSELFIRFQERVPVTAVSVLETSVNPGNRGAAHMGYLFDLFIGASVHQQNRDFQAVAHVREFVDRAKIFEEVIAFLHGFQTEYRAKQNVEFIIMGKGHTFTSCFSISKWLINENTIFYAITSSTSAFDFYSA